MAMFVDFGQDSTVQIDSREYNGILRRLRDMCAMFFPPETMPGEPVARWQSGYAAACKAADIGSIPFLASITSLKLSHFPSNIGEISAETQHFQRI